MAIQAEIEAAAKALDSYDDAFGIDKATIIAKLAIEAAERVRPHKTSTERTRRHRAKKRAAGNVPSNAASGNVPAMPEDVHGNVSANVPDVTGNVSGNVTAERNVTGNVPPDLLERLLQAANRNVQPAAGEPHAIGSLIKQGCDLDLDVLPVVRNLLRDPLQPPLKSWSVPWLAAEIVRRRDERTCHVTPAPAVRQPAAPPRPSGPPAAPSFDMDELVAGYRAGNVAWDATRFGPPPSSPGCRADPGILRANGYR